MEDWIHINTNDVISIFEKAKTGFPWGNYHNENYRRLILCYKKVFDEQLAAKAYNTGCTGSR